MDELKSDLQIFIYLNLAKGSLRNRVKYLFL